MITRRFGWMAVLVLAGLVANVGRASEEKKETPKLDPAALVKMYEDFAKLVPAHDEFKELAGQWKTEMKDFTTDPAQPTVLPGMATFELLLGGRYLQQKVAGKYDGGTFEGLGITGYDKTKKKYVSIWVDNMGTGIMNTEGDLDPATKTMVETGEADSPMGKMKMKMVTKHLNKDRFDVTMYVVAPDGSETKQAEIVYTRQ
jgi:hypothetical protein